MCLKLRIDQADQERASLIECVVDFLVDDAAVRTRVKPDILIDGLATLPRLRQNKYPPAISLETSQEQLQLALAQNPNVKSPIGSTVPSRRAEQLQSKAAGSVARKQLKKIRAESVVDVFGKPKISNENWIPEIIRFKSLQRDLAVAKENLMSSMVLESETKKELKRLSQSELDRALVQERLKSKKQVPCGCCEYLFSDVNLTLKVSMKAVTDIRKKWMNGKPNGFADPDGAKIGNVPRCYNEVSLCRFCAQFFIDQNDYRPSFDQIAYEERKTAHFEARRLEKEYWDPLKMCAKDEELRKSENEEQLNAAATNDEATNSGDDDSWASDSAGS
jgi:hypothetical protein